MFCSSFHVVPGPLGPTFGFLVLIYVFLGPNAQNLRPKGPPKAPNAHNLRILGPELFSGANFAQICRQAPKRSKSADPSVEVLSDPIKGEVLPSPLPPSHGPPAQPAGKNDVKTRQNKPKLA